MEVPDRGRAIARSLGARGRRSTIELPFVALQIRGAACKSARQGRRSDGGQAVIRRMISSAESNTTCWWQNLGRYLAAFPEFVAVVV